MDVHAVQRLSAGEAEYRHGVGECLGDAAEGVFGAGPGLHSEDADGVAVLYAAEAVGHVNAGALLPGQDGADALAGAGVYEALGGEGGDPLYAFLL